MYTYNKMKKNGTLEENLRIKRDSYYLPEETEEVPEVGGSYCLPEETEEVPEIGTNFFHHSLFRVSDEFCITMTVLVRTSSAKRLKKFSKGELPEGWWPLRSSEVAEQWK